MLGCVPKPGRLKGLEHPLQSPRRLPSHAEGTTLLRSALVARSTLSASAQWRCAGAFVVRRSAHLTGTPFAASPDERRRRPTETAKKKRRR